MESFDFRLKEDRVKKISMKFANGKVEEKKKMYDVLKPLEFLKGKLNKKYFKTK